MSTLAEAARYLDAQAEEHGGISKAVMGAGINLEDLRHVAEQRALRSVLHATGRLKSIDTTKAAPISLDANEESMMAHLTATYIDGITIGWAANRMAERDE